MQHPDLAIKDKENDKLNFLPFAQKVAKGIKNYKQNETFIISIEGKWGSGKTSLMNLIENEIKDDVEIMHFNPWLLTDIRQVITLFFDELIKVLCYGSFKAKWNEDIKKDIKTLANILLPDSINVDMKLVKVGYKPKDTFLKNDESLEKIKLRINEYLKSLNKKIVIIVDDIDRLTDQETEFIFRLTKGIADFDNLIYILLYDKSIVAKSLQTFKKEDGEKYLEKIVQYSLPVPKPHRLTLNNLLFEKIDEIIENLKQEENQIFFDRDKWSIVVDEVLTKHILTVRDINSIINIVSFEYPIVVEDVNFTDFFLLTLLRVKNNNLYESIYENQDKFLLDEKNIEDNFKTYLDEQKEFKNILELVFPNLQKNLNPEYPSMFKREDNNHRNKSLADKYYFENYFSLSIPEDKLAYKDFKEVENSIFDTNFDNFKDKILTIYEQKKIFLFLEMLEQNSLEKINNQNNLKNAFYNLINISYQFKKEFNKYFSFIYVSALRKCEKISYEILRKIENIEEFIKIFFFEKDEIPLIIKMDIFQDIKDENSINKLRISDEIKGEIFKFLKNKLENFSLNDLFKEIYNKLYLFERFKYFDISIDKISKEINEYMFESNDNFFKLLKEFKYCQISSDGNKLLIAKDVLEILVNLENVQKYINNLDDEIKIEYKELLEIWDRKSHF
ncbi:KAP family P-loop NTPase fold protein [Aliarcobacter butzleri]|uniref:KAP family P-loop NTPase fold protein n=1 Tax=Aliarcobacter butzleri TaxID=28197 RepID=UPI00263C1269|nr:P-loop NTPase fold protein [Aliarcobacter butzleri]MDN5050571.1 P-loop NTPase fold protein [Aliarcobacter butzleri]MDN5057701.1 P-loop NTPase fold protein [Aliarcobacter butzleri]MDN5110927.1 P-loop NTPase fold protein [Aliarcobacter butzleri]